MKAKKLISIFFLAVILCMITIFGVMADEATESTSKIIRFDNPESSILKTFPSNKVTNGVYRLDMPAEKAYGTTFAPDFSLKESLDLKEYPFVKIKMRTNYPETVQFYAIYANEKITYSSISNNTKLSDGNWHIVELKFQDGEKATYTGQEGYGYETKFNTDISIVSAPFFQFKFIKGTPSGDLFAEIEYIGFFKTEKDMKAYDEDNTKVLVNGKELYEKVSQSHKEHVELNDNNLRILHNNSSNQINTHVNEAFKDIYGEKLDLYEYPYAKIRFKTTYEKTVQFYPDTKGLFYTPFHETLNAVSDTNARYAQWFDAAVSYKNNSSSLTNTIKLNEYTWFTRVNSWFTDPTHGVTDLTGFPEEKSKRTTDSIFFELKGDNSEGYLDVAYVAFYKTEEAMLNDTSYVDADAAVTVAINSAKNLTFTLHPAIGEIALENYVRETIETANTGVYVTADAVDFDYAADSCKVNITVTDDKGVTSRTEEVTVNFEKLEFDLTMLGAQIRARDVDAENKFGNSDLRFGATLNYDNTNYTDVKYGMILSAINTELTDNSYQFEKITHKKSSGTYGSKPAYTYTDTNNKTQTAYYECVVAEASTYYKTDIEGEQLFTVVVTEIPYTDGTNNGYGVVIVARPYVTYKLAGDSKEYTYYGSEIQRSVNGVKEALGADVNGPVNGEVTKDGVWDKDNK